MTQHLLLPKYGEYKIAPVIGHAQRDDVRCSYKTLAQQVVHTGTPKYLYRCWTKLVVYN